jgi:hypothetical protein
MRVLKSYDEDIRRKFPQEIISFSLKINEATII